MTSSRSYSIAGYGGMIADAVRMDAYAAALERAVRPGCTVLDIGAGTGIFSLLACRFGAGRVYAVEPDGAIQVAREIAVANGYADRIEFIQDLSTRVTLPAPADVIISDLRGVLPLFQHHIPAIADARRRLLAAGGSLIPRRDIVWAAPIEATDSYLGQFGLPFGPVRGFDMSAARQLSANGWRRVNLKAEALLAGPQAVAELDYSAIEAPDMRAELAWRIERPGPAHGLAVWFDAELAEGLGFSNAPGRPALIYGQAFFPLAEPVAVEPGDALAAFLAADLVGDDYVWRWETTVSATGDPARPKAAFRQSTFFGAPVTAAQVRRQGAGYVPDLDADGQIARAILNLMDGDRPQGEIARAVAAQFPTHFPDWHAALTLVSDLARRYGR